VQESVAIGLGENRSTFGKRRLVLRLQQGLPARFIESEERVVIDSVALRAVLSNHLPYRPIRPVDFRPRCAAVLRGDRQCGRYGERGHYDQSCRPNGRFVQRQFHTPLSLLSSQTRKTSGTVAEAVAMDTVQIEKTQEHVRT